MIGVSFTKERLLKLYARINETGVSKVWTFLNSDGTAHNISSYNFKLIVKLRSSTGTNLFTLTIGSGLTVQGASSNELLIEISQLNLTRKVDTNFWTLFSIAENKTWLNGPFFFHDGEFDGVDESDEILIGATATVNITVGGDSSGNPFQGFWDASGGTLPPSASLGQEWTIGDGVSEGTGGGDVPYLSGTVYLAPRSMIKAVTSSPGQNFFNWVNY